VRISFPSGALWKHAGFLRLWAAQTVSSFGARIAREGFAMSAILAIHATPAELGVLAALARGPGIVVGLIAGGFVDRTSRRRVMIGSDLARVALIVTVPLAAWAHALTMTQLCLVAALVGACNVLFEIADHAFLPSLIDRELLLDGNAKLSVTDAVAEIGGPAAAGTLFQLFTAPFAMLGTAFTYLISAAFLFAVPATELPPEAPLEKPRWYRDVAEGFRAIMAEPLVRPVFWTAMISTAFATFFAPLYLIYGLKTLGLSPALMGVNIAMGGIGAMTSAVLATWLSRRFGVGPAIIACSFASPLAQLLVPLAHGPLWLATAMLMTAQFIGDATAVVTIILLTSLRQAILPPAMLGRTAAVLGAVVGGSTIIGSIVGGLLGGWIGIRETFLISVAGIVAAQFFVVFSPLRTLRAIPGQLLKGADREPI
jgi:MFS family permease